MRDGGPIDVDDPRGFPDVSFEEILEAESIERYPDERVVVVDGEIRFDPYSELAVDDTE